MERGLAAVEVMLRPSSFFSRSGMLVAMASINGGEALIASSSVNASL
jgi:hypothetical protein